MPERSSRYQQPPPHHRRKTPSFSSSLLDSILRSIDETTTDGGALRQHQPQLDDQDLMFHEPKRATKLEEEHDTPRAIMIDQWIHTHSNNRNCYVSNSKTKKSCRTVSYDFSSSSGTTSSETPSTYRSLPNSFTISRDDDIITARRDQPKFMKSTKLKAMKIYADLKKVKQPISPGSRISAFIYSLFASSSSKKKAKKIEESMQTFRSLKKSRSINNNNKQQQDTTTTTCNSFSRSCMSKKQHSNNTHVKRSVRFYPENDTTVIIHEGGADSTPVPKYERRWFTEKNYNNNFVVNVEDDDDEDEGEDDLFELEIVTSAYRQELPVFETTDLRKIRI